MTMQISERGLDLIRAFEGCRFRAYLDGGGVATIGYGHTAGVHMGQECDMAQAVEWLKQDVRHAENAVNAAVRVPMTQAMFDALVSFVFNVGAAALRGSTLLRLLNQGDINLAADQFKRWDKDNGVSVPGLLRRRLAEAKLFLS